MVKISKTIVSQVAIDLQAQRSIFSKAMRLKSRDSILLLPVGEEVLLDLEGGVVEEGGGEGDGDGEADGGEEDGLPR